MILRKETVKPFEGFFVKLVYKNGFILFGTISKVFEDCLRFTTRQKTSLISFSEISEITPTIEKYKERR